MRPRFFIFILCAAFALLGGKGAFAFAPQDGFAPARKIESRYFNVQLAPGVDELSLIKDLGIGSQDKILAGQPLDVGEFKPDNLGDLLDAFFQWSCGVLDMQLFSYRGSIKVVQDEKALADIYRKLYGAERTGDKAFYIYEANTIYVAQASFTREIVGHEVAHAIISNFFVVQPPAKVQEVLAGYIEYQLRKVSSRP